MKPGEHQSRPGLANLTATDDVGALLSCFSLNSRRYHLENVRALLSQHLAYLQELVGVFLGETRETRRLTAVQTSLDELNQVPERSRTIQVPKRLPLHQIERKKVRMETTDINCQCQKTYIIIDLAKNPFLTLGGQFVKVVKDVFSPEAKDFSRELIAYSLVSSDRVLKQFHQFAFPWGRKLSLEDADFFYHALNASCLIRRQRCWHLRRIQPVSDHGLILRTRHGVIEPKKRPKKQTGQLVDAVEALPFVTLDNSQAACSLYHQ